MQREQRAGDQRPTIRAGSCCDSGAALGAEQRTPSSAKAICAKVCSVVLTVIAAAASAVAHAALRQMPDHEHGPPIWPARHQAVGGLPDPARQHAHRAVRAARAASARTARESPPRRAQRQQMEQRHAQQAPAGQRQTWRTWPAGPARPARPMNSSSSRAQEPDAPLVSSRPAGARAAALPRDGREIPDGSRSRRPRPSCWRSKRHQRCMRGSVTYSNVSDTRSSPSPSGEMRWRSVSPSKNTSPPGAICSEPAPRRSPSRACAVRNPGGRRTGRSRRAAACSAGPRNRTCRSASRCDRPARV